MTQKWIDFKVLREQLDFVEVLRHYGVELKRKKNQLVGFCPLPNHNGQRKSPSFSVNAERNCFNCFGCHRSGNCLDFAIYMEGKDPENRQHVREVALLLQERFHLNGAANQKQDVRPLQRNAAGDTPPAKPSPKQAESDRGAQEKPSEIQARPVIVNAPLDFELRGLDPKHPYLKERGFSEKTIVHFGLGFCNRGLMQGRVVIPLRDQAGKLIGYAGRFTRDDQVGEKVPKYLFPGDRERNGIVLEFRKSLFLYNGRSIQAPVDDLIVVEGFPSVWWLWQAGFANVVALMGSSCSKEQATIIRSLVSEWGRVWLLPDAGEAGDLCAESVLEQVAPHRFTRWLQLDDGQPTDLRPKELATLFERRVHYEPQD
jgi:DNA primase